MICQSFPPTLRRGYRLHSNFGFRSIKTFDKLSKNFVAYFLSSKRNMKTFIIFMQVVHVKDKPLQDFLARFSYTCHKGSSNM